MKITKEACAAIAAYGMIYAVAYHVTTTVYLMLFDDKLTGICLKIKEKIGIT